MGHRSAEAAGNLMGETHNLLRQDFELGYCYTRSTGPVIGRFLTGLRDRRIVGVRASDGRVLVPPMEFDPLTSEPLADGDFVELESHGEVLSWAWVAQPRAQQPLEQPFAYALIRLSNEGTGDAEVVPMLHAVAVDGDESAMHSGMSVRACWADERVGTMADLRYFTAI